MRKLVLGLGVYFLVGCSPGAPLLGGVYFMVGFNSKGGVTTKNYMYVDEASCEKFRNKIPRSHGNGLQSMLELDGKTTRWYPKEQTRCVPAY